MLRDALREMETLVDGKPPKFSVVACNFSRDKNTGGDITEYKDVTLNGLKADSANRVPEEFRRERSFTNTKINPKHRENKTLNLRLPNGEIRKVHKRFLLKYNDKQILQ